ncbi:MAG TPA: hypothetical protein VFR04_05860 [Solirubrobacterales bacterium]|nr:hypothetical protein [Solirubrobacterales bacterium]
MSSRLRPKITYSNAIATIALFIALGGAAVAAGLPKKSVGPQQLKRGAVTAAAIRKAAVTSGKLAPKSVIAGKLGANAVLPGNLGNGIIGTEKLGDGAVIASKIKNGVVTANKLANSAVTTPKLADGSVTAAKLAQGVPPLPETLPSGQTERGLLEIGGNTTFTRTGTSFPIQLAFLPQGHILEVGQSTPQCPGRTFKNHGHQTPEAAPGHLCLYIALKQGKGADLALTSAIDTSLGFGVEAAFQEPVKENLILAFWAVTAP